MNPKMSYWLMPMYRQKEPELILNEVASAYNITVGDIRGRSRRRAVSEARQIAAYFLYDMFNVKMAHTKSKWGTKKVGEYIGGKDHVTVLYSIKVVNGLLETDPWFKERFELIKSKIYK